jgi:hypothetical protein
MDIQQIKTTKAVKHKSKDTHTTSTIMRTCIRVRNQIAKNGGVWALTTQKGK